MRGGSDAYTSGVFQHLKLRVEAFSYPSYQIVVPHPNLPTQRRNDKTLGAAAKGQRPNEITTGAESIPSSLPPLVRKLIVEAEAEEKLIQALIEAVEGGAGHEQVFRIVQQLTKSDARKRTQQP